MVLEERWVADLWGEREKREGEGGRGGEREERENASV